VLAAQLERYDLLRQHDRQRRTPGTDLLHTLLAGGPTLILMDEIAEYAAKARDIQEQVMGFFQELTETVKALPQCALVVTLPSSAPYGEEGERALDQLQSIFGRVEAIYTPVEGDEVFEVIRRRLFKGLEDPPEARQVADAYWDLYQHLGEDAPAEAREPAYRERMRQAYPFHPQVIDILYERWSTFHTFQRTRGALRLLANVVSDLWQHKHAAPLIQAAHINLAEPAIRREFLKHIGNEYDGVISADIVDTNARAQRIDREMGSEYARFNVASGLATAIFFGSFSGSQRRGVNAPSLRMALLREEIPPAIVGDALGRMEEALWYLHCEGGLYQFRSQPNLNRVIIEHEEAVSEDDISAEIRRRLNDMAGNDVEPRLYPQAPEDIPDNRKLELGVLSGKYHAHDPATTKSAGELLNSAGTTFRVYRNTVLILAADVGELAGVRQQVKRYLALCDIQENRSLWSTLTEGDRSSVLAKQKDADGGADFQLLTAYRYLGRAGSDGIQWLDLGLPTAGGKTSLTKRALDYLKSQDLLLDRIAPRHLVEKAMSPEEEEKPLFEVYEAFLRYPDLPILESAEVFRRAVQQGVREGTFGVRSGEHLYFREGIGEPESGPEATLVRAEVARREKEGTEILLPPPGGGEKPSGGRGGGAGTGPEPGPEPEAGIRSVTLHVRVPWEKMSDFVRGVLMPLHNDGASLSVEIKVQAKSESGIKKGTLDQKVDETLRQIGAEVLEDKEE